jgi:siroheme synthase
LYLSELYKFAYTYAATELGQTGQGLSNKDFANALSIVAAGKGDSFTINIKKRAAEIVQRADLVIIDAQENTVLKKLGQIDPDQTIMDGYMRSSEEFATSRGFKEPYDWAKSEDAPSEPKPKTITRTVTDKMIEKFPELEGQKGQEIVLEQLPDGNYKPQSDVIRFP